MDAYKYKITWSLEYIPGPNGSPVARTARVEVLLKRDQYAGLRGGTDAEVLNPILHAQARVLLGVPEVEFFTEVGQPHRIYRAPATAHAGWTVAP